MEKRKVRGVGYCASSFVNEKRGKNLDVGILGMQVKNVTIMEDSKKLENRKFSI